MWGVAHWGDPAIQKHSYAHPIPGNLGLTLGIAPTPLYTWALPSPFSYFLSSFLVFYLLGLFSPSVFFPFSQVFNSALSSFNSFPVVGSLPHGLKSGSLLSHLPNVCLHALFACFSLLAMLCFVLVTMAPCLTGMGFCDLPSEPGAPWSHIPNTGKQTYQKLKPGQSKL